MSMDYFNVRLTLALTNSYVFSEQNYKLKPTSRLVLMHMANCIDSDTLQLYPSMEHLKKACGVDRTGIVRAIKDLEHNNVLQVLRSKYKNKPKNYYKFKDDFLELIDKNLKIRGRKPLFNETHSVKMHSKTVSKCINISDKKTQNHEIHECHDYWRKKFNFRSEIQKEFRNIILKLSEQEAKNYWFIAENGAERETKPWEKRQILEKYMIKQQKILREEKEHQAQIEEAKARENEPQKSLRNIQIEIILEKYHSAGEKTFKILTYKKIMKNHEITEAEIRDIAAGYKQQELTK